MKNVFLILMIALLGSCTKKNTPASNTSGIITTIAGNGTREYSGDGWMATAAGLGGPYGIAVDGKGNIYIAGGLENNRVRKISTSGIITTIAGNGYSTQPDGYGGYTGDGGQATDAELNIPAAVAVDRSGNVYIADESNARIRKVTSDGIITTIAGGGTGGLGDGGQATDAELQIPSGIAVDSNGNIYIADMFNNRIRKVNTSGIITTVAGGGTVGGYNGPATSVALDQPRAIAIDNNGNIYFTQTPNGSASTFVFKINNSGILSTTAGNGTNGYSGDGGMAIAAKLGSVLGLATDDLGNLYIADALDNVVRKVSTDGIIVTYAGNGDGAGTGTGGYTGDGELATKAELWSPNGIAIDASGNLFISDYGNNRIRKVSN